MFSHSIQKSSLYIDGLFGQCWNGQGSVRSAFAVQEGVDGLSDDKLIAIDTTIDFLNRYHLDWKEYMTQCILSHILSTEHSDQWKSFGIILQ